MKDADTTIIFTDGAARGNPGPGGYAHICWSGDTVWEGGGKEDHTTNNRMEIRGAIEALTSVKQRFPNISHITLHTDSAYLINGATKWLSSWYENDWKTKTKKEVKNVDLWQALDRAMKGLAITWVRISGHAGVPGNERVDQIATAYADNVPEKLFSGTYSKYGIDLTSIKADAYKKSKKSRKGEAYSYISIVDGKVQVHKTWKECEARVKCTSGARFKKALSAIEEIQIAKEFGWH